MPIYTLEFKQDGETRMIEIGASNEKLAIERVKASLRNAVGGIKLDEKSLKTFKDAGASAKHIAARRKELGKSPLDDNALLDNQAQVFGQPPDPEEKEDDE